LRVALFSDVHGNAVAFEAMLADLALHSVDEVVCLGDHAQGGPQPARCLELLRELGCPVVMGNSDHFVLTLDPGHEAVTDEQRANARWTQKQLSDDLLEFHRTFQPTVRLDLGKGGSLLAFHGSPRSRDEVLGPWLEEAAFREPFLDVEATILAGGHTHQQWARRLDTRYFVNPGSVGLAYDHHWVVQGYGADPYAEYAIVTVDGSVAVEWRRVPFDRDEVLRAVEASGIPHPELSLELWRQRETPT
jgi:predicted phosphodiesterase